LTVRPVWEAGALWGLVGGIDEFAGITRKAV